MDVFDVWLRGASVIEIHDGGFGLVYLHVVFVAPIFDGVDNGGGLLSGITKREYVVSIEEVV